MNDYNDEDVTYRGVTKGGTVYEILDESPKCYRVRQENGKVRSIYKHHIVQTWRESQQPLLAAVPYGLMVKYHDHTTEFVSLGNLPLTMQQVCDKIASLMEDSTSFLHCGPVSFQKANIRNYRVYVRKHH